MVHSNKKFEWQDLWLWFLAALVACIIAAFSVEDMIYMWGFIFVGWVFFILGLLVNKTLGKVKKIIWSIIVALIVVGLGTIIFIRHHEPVSEAIIESQLPEL